MKNIHNLIKDIFEEKWKENFIFDGINQRSIKYSEFFSEISSLQNELIKKNIHSGDIICTVLDNSVEFIKILFASLLSNITLVPIDPEKGKDEIEEIINYVKPKTVIFNKLEYNFFQNKIQIEEINKKIIQESKDNLSIINNIDLEKDFLITFTSGSSGIPKGVVHSFKNLIMSALSFNKKFNFNSKNIFLHNLPMSYMAGILNLIFLPFICQSQIVVDHRFSVKTAMNFWKIPIEYEVNTFWFTPTIIGLLLKFDRGNDGKEYSEKKEILGCVGTSALNPTIKKEFENKYKINLYESYGLSEVLFVSTNSPNLDNENVGEILNDVEINFKNNEILIKVPWMYKRYQNLDDKYIINGYFISGDLGNISKNNILTITGRKKDLIIKGGINISPKKLEDFIINEKKFRECVVMGFPDKVLGEKTTCFILKNDNTNELKKEINKKIIEKLGKNYHIDEFIQLNEIPKNVNGKIDKPQIREMYLKNDVK